MTESYWLWCLWCLPESIHGSSGPLSFSQCRPPRSPGVNVTRVSWAGVTPSILLHILPIPGDGWDTCSSSLTMPPRLRKKAQRPYHSTFGISWPRSSLAFCYYHPLNSLLHLYSTVIIWTGWALFSSESCLLLFNDFCLHLALFFHSLHLAYFSLPCMLHIRTLSGRLPHLTPQTSATPLSMHSLNSLCIPLKNCGKLKARDNRFLSISLNESSGWLMRGDYVCFCAVAQLCLTFCGLMDCSPPGSSVHGILQARILEWVAMPLSRESSQLRDWTHSSCSFCIAGGFFTAESLG